MGFMVIQYFPSYRTVAEYPDRMFKMCNVVNYAFSEVTSGSTITAPSAIKFDSVRSKAKANGAKIFYPLMLQLPILCCSGMQRVAIPW